MKESIKRYCQSRCLEFSRIEPERKAELDKISAYLRYKKGEEANLIILEEEHRIIGPLLQIWVNVAAEMFAYSDLHAISVGVGVKEFDTNFLHLMLNIGFDIECKDQGARPTYTFYLSEDKKIICQSKLLSEIKAFPDSMFGFLETGMDPKSLDYPLDLVHYFSFTDPLWAEGSSKQEEVLHKLIGQIAREMLYVFHRIADDVQFVV